MSSEHDRTRDCMKLATNCVPHMGGTYSSFRRLRVGLAAHGISLRWLGIGPAAAAVMRHDAWAHERSNGEVVAPDVTDAAGSRAARLVIEHLEQEHYDGFLVNVLCDKLLTNLMRYLPTRLCRVLVVHNMTPGTYQAARAVRDFVPAAICVSSRIRRDLVAGYGFDRRRTFVVPNAVDLGEYRNIAPRRAAERPLRAIFLGRLEEESKGILWLPKILAALDDLDVTLTVAGDGPDRTRLQNACAAVSERVSVVGPVPPNEVPDLLARHDVFLMTSRYEGFPHSLVEAMAAGCVPVASRIKGVTDTVIEDGISGLLFPIGDVRAAADSVRRLARDPKMLSRMSEVAIRNTRDRFSIEATASQYADLIRQARDAPARTATPLPLERWSYPWRLRPGPRTYLPVPVKNSLRLWRERFAA